MKIKNSNHCEKLTARKQSHEIATPYGLAMTEQTGRSMVEMLGVLAVIGVLSVGGVAMYTSAMNKHRANEILNEASKRAVMVAGQLLTNPSATTMSLAQFGSNAVAGATFEDDAAISNGKITLTFETAPDEAICNQMIAATGTNSAMQIASGCGTITFNTDMSKGGTTTSSGCPKAGYTGDNCDERIVCQHGGTWTENGCECPQRCDTAWTGADCSVCDGYMADGCYPCDYADGPDGAFMTTAEECAKCGNQREFIQVEENNAYYCVVTDCGEGNFRNMSGYCLPCSAEDSVDTDSTQCAKCDGTAYPRKMQDNHCVPNW